MFIPWEQHYAPFLTNVTYSKHREDLAAQRYKIFTGHMNHTPVAGQLLKRFRHILLIRDPYVGIPSS